jgi:kynurenine 3-monooxygenase
MNASFEDVLVLDEMHDAMDGEWSKILPAYEVARKPDTDAIADLALDNFIEMQDKVADPVFIKKRDLEMKLEQTYTDYYSKYSLVTFKEDFPYHKAMNLGRKQDQLLLNLCREKEVAELNLAEVHRQMMALSDEM